MSSSTIILLPLHAPSNMVLMAFAAAFGKTVRHSNSSADTTRPSCEENIWYVLVEGGKEHFNFTMETNAAAARMNFQDSAGATHSWLFIMDHEKERRCIIADSDALAVALGERLVRMFGGELSYDNRAETPRGLRASRPTLPARVRRENPDDRFYRQQNALAAIPHLSSRELIQGARHSAYGIDPPRVKNLLGELEAREAGLRLDATLASGTRSPPRTRM